MKIINVDRLTIVPLKLYNVYDLKSWETHKDPLFDDYNFPDLDDYEIRLWYRERVSKSTAKSFAVLLDGRVTIGLINLKNIRSLLKVASLGIVFNPKYINKGYGTTSLKAIIKYYFETMNMRSLYLDVAKHNKRAIRCYEKCGFKIVKTYTIKLMDIRLEEISKDYTNKDYFVRDDIVYLYCYKMRLSKNDYAKLLKRRENCV